VEGKLHIVPSPLKSSSSAISEYMVPKEIFSVLYLTGEPNPDFFSECIKRFLNNQEIEMLYPNDIEKLKSFRKYLYRLFSGLDNQITDTLSNLKIEEDKQKDSFIDNIPPNTRISKNEINRIVKLHKSTLLKNSSSFKDYGRAGIDLKSFLTWLKFYSPKKYEMFKSNYYEKS